MVLSQSGSWRTSPYEPLVTTWKQRCALQETTSILASLRNAPAWLQTSTLTEHTLNSPCPNSATSAQSRGRIASHSSSARTCPSYLSCTKTSSTTSPTLSREIFSLEIPVNSLKTWFSHLRGTFHAGWWLIKLQKSLRLTRHFLTTVQSLFWTKKSLSVAILSLLSNLRAINSVSALKRNFQSS